MRSNTQYAACNIAEAMRVKTKFYGLLQYAMTQRLWGFFPLVNLNGRSHVAEPFGDRFS